MVKLGELAVEVIIVLQHAAPHSSASPDNASRGARSAITTCPGSTTISHVI